MLEIVKMIKENKYDQKYKIIRCMSDNRKLTKKSQRNSYKPGEAIQDARRIMSETHNISKDK